jgi:hypothetical protein
MIDSQNCCEPCFLQNIVGIDTAMQTWIHAETDYSPQPIAIV